MESFLAYLLNTFFVVFLFSSFFYLSINLVFFFDLKLHERDFRFCPEVNTKLSKIRENILEVPLSYNGRSYDEGKKIKLVDGFKAVYSLFKRSFFKN